LQIEGYHIFFQDGGHGPRALYLIGSSLIDTKAHGMRYNDVKSNPGPSVLIVLQVMLTNKESAKICWSGE